jgi:peptidoglycan/xylan/chitin deacetylase (PgdA/CDA1 family)
MRNFLLFLAHITGLLKFYRYLNRKNITIILLHGVVNPEKPKVYEPLRSQLSLEDFHSSLDLIAEYYNFISMDHAIRIIKGEEKWQPYSVVLTFDDGYRNNLTEAAPILQKMNIPLTIYLTTGLITRREPMWVDRMDYSFKRLTSPNLTFQLSNHIFSLSGKTLEQKATSFKQFRNQAKRIACNDYEFQFFMQETNKELEQLAKARLADIWEKDDFSVLLNADEVRAFKSATYGSHTVNHSRISLLDSAEVLEELKNSKQEVEAWTENQCHHFAYPDGRHDRKSQSLVAEAGYLSAVTADEGLNQPGCNPYTLKRISFPIVHSKHDLLARMCGFSVLLSRTKARTLAKVSNIRP